MHHHLYAAHPQNLNPNPKPQTPKPPPLHTPLDCLIIGRSHPLRRLWQVRGTHRGGGGGGAPAAAGAVAGAALAAARDRADGV